MASIIAGCYTAVGYQPTVNTYTDPNTSPLNQDKEERRQLVESAREPSRVYKVKTAFAMPITSACRVAAIKSFDNSLSKTS